MLIKIIVPLWFQIQQNRMQQAARGRLARTVPPDQSDNVAGHHIKADLL
jgi:hypothetical protein